MIAQAEHLLKEVKVVCNGEPGLLDATTYQITCLCANCIKVQAGMFLSQGTPLFGHLLFQRIQQTTTWLCMEGAIGNYDQHRLPWNVGVRRGLQDSMLQSLLQPQDTPIAL